MSDYPRELSTTKPPSDDPMAIMAELQAALVNAGALMVKLQTTLAVTQLAVLTQEHKTNNAHDRIDLLTDRVESLEGLAAE